MGEFGVSSKAFRSSWQGLRGQSFYSVLYGVLYGFIGVYRVLYGFIWFYRVLYGFMGFYSALYGFIWFCRVLEGFIGFYRALYRHCSIPPQGAGPLSSQAWFRKLGWVPFWGVLIRFRV